jgi:hypothetical protein
VKKKQELRIIPNLGYLVDGGGVAETEKPRKGAVGRVG